MHGLMQTSSREKSNSSLETLRIVQETASTSRSWPQNPHARRRFKESLNWALRHHDLEAVSEAADMTPREVLDTILPQMEGVETETVDATMWRVRRFALPRLAPGRRRSAF